jgi:hypothetical protein
VALWRLQFATAEAEALRATAAPAAPPFEHPAAVCSASWNQLGTTLATAATDGRVRLFAENLLGEWGEQMA